MKLLVASIALIAFACLVIMILAMVIAYREYHRASARQRENNDLRVQVASLIQENNILKLHHPSVISAHEERINNRTGS